MRKWGIAAVAALWLGIGLGAPVWAAEVTMKDLMSHLGVQDWVTTYSVPVGAKEVDFEVKRYDRNKTGNFVSSLTNSGVLGKGGPVLRESYDLRILSDDHRLTLNTGVSVLISSIGQPLPKTQFGSPDELPAHVGNGTYLLWYGSGPSKGAVSDVSVGSDGSVHASPDVSAYLVLVIKSS